MASVYIAIYIPALALTLTLWQNYHEDLNQIKTMIEETDPKPMMINLEQEEVLMKAVHCNLCYKS